MKNRFVTVTLISLALALGIGAPSALAAPTVMPRPAVSETASGPASATSRSAAQEERASDTTRYAAQEKAQPRAANFEGGAVIVIAGPALAIVFAFMLLLVIL